MWLGCMRFDSSRIRNDAACTGEGRGGVCDAFLDRYMGWEGGEVGM